MDSFEVPDSVPLDLWPLVPETPADMQALFALIREALQRSFAGHEQIVAQLALLGATHIAQDVLPRKPLSRALLIAENETGKTPLALQLARVLDVPFVHVPASSVAETNWSGTDVTDLIAGMYKEVFRHHSPAETAELAERAVVIVDDIDQLRLPGRYTSSPQTHDYQAGRQRSLVPVVGDGVVPIKVGANHISWPSRRALVISVGAFAGLEASRPGPDHLADWGMLPELARALCLGPILRVPGPTHGQRRQLIRKEVRSLEHTFRLYGYRLAVSGEALSYVADRLGPGGSFDLAPVRSLLRDAASRALIRMLSDGAPQGALHVLAPDDLEPPTAARGSWRE